MLSDRSPREEFSSPGSGAPYWLSREEPGRRCSEWWPWLTPIFPGAIFSRIWQVCGSPPSDSQLDHDAVAFGESNLALVRFATNKDVLIGEEPGQESEADRM